MRLAPRLALAALALLGLAACETVPKPFRHDDGAVSALARPKMGRGIAVRLGAAIPAGQSLGAALVKGFEEREVPASLRRGPGFGRTIEVEADGVTIKWRMLAADGAEMDSWTTPGSLPAAQAAAAAVARVMPLLEDPDAKPQVGTAKLPPPARVRLTPMRGLPGDGDTALLQALTKALSRQGVAVADPSPYTVVGVVAVTPAGATEDTVTVSWLVKQGDAGGVELARIDQGGAVPRGRLNLPWGSLARDIAEGGATSIAEVVRMAERNRQDQENQGGSRQFTEAGTADIGKPDSSEETTPARTTPPQLPAEPASTQAAAPDQAPPSAPPAPTPTVEPAKPKPAKAVTKSKSRAQKSTSPAQASKAKPAPRTKPHR